MKKKKIIWPLAILLCVILGGIRVGDKEPVAVYAADGDVSSDTLIDSADTIYFYLYYNKAQSQTRDSNYVEVTPSGGKVRTPSSVGGYTVYAWRPMSATDYAAVLDVPFTYYPGEGSGEPLTEHHYTIYSSGSAANGFELASGADFERANYKHTGWLTGDGKKFEFGSNIIFPGITTAATFTAAWTEKDDSSVELSAASPIYAGDSLPAKISVTKSPATASVRLEYKTRGAADTAYTTTAPTTPGEYTVRGTISETEDYKPSYGTADFEILPASVDVNVKYNPNGGTGTSFNRNETVDLRGGDGEIELLSVADSGFIRPNYKLVGWKEKTDGIVYSPGSIYGGITSDTASLEFDATWQKKMMLM